MAHTISLPTLDFPRATSFSRLGATLAGWRRRSAEKRELARFDARDLRDAGLTAADQSAILATPFWREAARRR